MTRQLAVRVSALVVLAFALVAAVPVAAQNWAEVVWEETWLPGSLACGQRVTARVTMRNVGATTWTNDVYKLGPVDDSDELNGPARVYIESAGVSEVAPGEQVTFEFELQAPGATSVRWTDWQMVHEGVEWFGEVAGQQVEVVCAAPVDGAQVVAANLPSSLECGQFYQASVTMKNTGTTTWSEAELYRLGAVGDADDLGGPGRVLMGGGQVPPGGQYTFRFELRAPDQANPAALTDWRMVHDGVAWFGGIAAQTVAVTCTPPTDDAQVIAVNLPASLECGQTYQASVTMRNTGTTTWTPDVYKLGAAGDGDDLGGPGRIYLNGNVPPGGSYTFSFELRAPDQANPAALTDWRMVHDGVAWFGGIAAQTVAVTCTPPTDDAQVVAVNLPASLECGQVYMASVTMRNTGTTTWTPDVYKLGAAGDSDDLGGPGRIYLNGNIPPGGQYTFSFELRASDQANPAALTDWRMVHDGVAWFGEAAAQLVAVSCTPPTDGAQVVALDLPASLECGQTYQASVTMRNTGTTTWSEEGLYRLGPVGDQDDLNGPARVLMGGEQVPPGGEYTFSFELRAPDQPNPAAVTDWQMVHDNVAWFGGIAAQTVAVSCTTPTDDAQVVAADLPSWLQCWEPYQASVTMKNTGTTTWTADVYALGAVDDYDDLEGPVRVQLPTGVSVPPGGEHTFAFELRALGPRDEPAHTDWRMVHEGVAWFGQVAERFVVVECPPEPPVSFPVRPGLWPASDEESSPDDLDGDGIPQSRELELASAFFPTVWMDVEERCPAPGGSVVRPGVQQPGRLVFRVRPHPADTSKIAISYALLYARDCGDGVVPFDSHHGDVEPFAVTLEPDATCPSGYGARAIKTWAHQGTIGEAVDARNLGGRCLYGASGEVISRLDVVFASEDKHGNYLSLSACDGGAFSTDHCSFGFTMGDENAWVGYNAGEPSAPRHHDLAPLGFPGERMWSGLDFCGGFPHQGNCPDPVENKMGDQFVAPVEFGGPFPCQELGGVCSETGVCPMDYTPIEGASDCEVCCKPPVDGAEVVDFDLPASLACWQTYQASVTMRNTGTATWSEEGLYRLGAMGDSDDLNGPGRVLLLGVEVPPGAEHTFTFELRAPDQPNPAAITDWQMVHDNVAWFGGNASQGVAVTCAGSTDDAQVVASDLPSSLECGQTYQASVTMRNSGTTTWTDDVYKLGALGDSDDLGGPGRVYLPPGTTVEPGGEHTFSFTLVAPTSGSGGLTDWRMVHEDVAWFGASAERYVTFDCECAVGRCAAGCAHVPTFTVSDNSVGVARPVTFMVTNPESILDEFPNWDFGDGEHCEHCPRTVTHVYQAPGTYYARLTATESRCQLTVVSQPVPITVFDSAVPRNDNAEVIGTDLPTALCTGSYPAKVTMRNIGNTPWMPGEYFLGAVDDADPFSDVGRIPLTREVGPQEVHTFEFTLRPATVGCPFERCRTDWQMVREGVRWFGGIASQDVATSGCTTPGPGDFTCHASAHDEYGRPLPGRAVILEAFENGGKDAEPDDWAVGETDADGRAVVGLEMQSVTRQLKCRVELAAAGRNQRASIFDANGLPAGSIVVVDAVAVPEPTHTHAVVGLKGASAMAHLYQSGEYDRVVMLPEPINPDEQKKGPRTRESFWQEFRDFALLFSSQGFDVWLMNSSGTGNNIHEQAAETAQAIEFAARGYPAAYGAAPGFDGKVVTIGISLGGVVSRIATARWESGAAEDAVWRDQLGLGSSLPVSLIVFIDSPLRGANVPVSLQSFIWNPFGIPGVSRPEEINMNSCAFQQLVRKASWQLTNCEAGLPNPTCNWRAFYEDGRAVRFRAPGVCDSRSGSVCRCDSGPAVFSINGDGFARGPRTIAYSDGKPYEANQCYGDSRDLDRGGRNMCQQSPWPRVLLQGEEWLQMDVNNFPDEHFYLTTEDLEPGSRQSSLDGRKFFGVDWLPIADETVLRQFSSPTFIPLSSAFGSGSEACAVSECFHNTFNGGHVMPRGSNVDRIKAEILAATGGGSPTPMPPSIGGSFSAQPDQAVVFDVTAGDTGARFAWDLGDGTVRSGASATHTYRRAGIYPVVVTAEMPDGSLTTSTAVARIGVAANEAPSVSVRPVTPSSPGASVAFTGAVSDADGKVVRTFWNFGDGEFGEGLTVAHTYAEPGTYTVTFSATDDEGAWTSAETIVAVGTPPAPTPLAPTGSVPAGVVTLSWSAVPQATGYRAVVLDGSNATVFSVEVEATAACSGSSCSIQSTSELVPGEYAWLVLGHNEAGDGLLAPATRFTVMEVPNRPPAVSIEVSSSCSSLCTVTFTAVASDPDGDALSFAWAGCGTGSESSVTCQTRIAGDHAGTVTVTDARGASTTASRTVTAFVSEWAAGTWGPCTGTGEFTCTATGPGGCSRPGTQTRSVKPIAQTLDPLQAAPQPPSSQPCTETTTGYVASWAVGPWSACSVPCGGGIQARSVTPATFTATAPGVDQPPAIQSCNTQACGLTCANYTNMYPTKQQCYAAGWAVCEVRYRGDGLGGTIRCWKGFS